MSVVDVPILYVNIDTMKRLIITGRARPVSSDGITVTAFPDNDPLYPNARLLVSSDVFGNAVHRRTEIPSENSYRYDFVGDV
jgi:hypothetical protein